MFERILVALDNPEGNKHLVTTAIALARNANARLLLLHVLPLEATEDVSHSTEICTSDHAHSEWQNCQTRDLEKLRSIYKLINTAGVAADIAQPIGNAGQKICELAHQWGADLIVLGRRDFSIAHPSLGSVSRYVASNAFCSTIVLQNQSSENVATSTMRSILEESDLLSVI